MWLRIDDQFGDHPKVEELSDAAFRFHIRAMCWAARHRTDGLIPDGALPGLARGKRIAKLTKELSCCVPIPGKSGLWVKVLGGWQLHDWSKYNPSQAETQAKDAETSRKRSEAGKKGAAAKHGKAGKGGGKAPSKQGGKTLANAEQSGWQKPDPVPVPVPLNKIPPPPNSDPDNKTPELGQAAGGGGATRKREDLLPIQQRAWRYHRDPGARTYIGEPCDWPEVATLVARYVKNFPGKVCRFQRYQSDKRLAPIVEALSIYPVIELEMAITAAGIAMRAGKLSEPKFQSLHAVLGSPTNIDRWVEALPDRERARVLGTGPEPPKAGKRPWGTGKYQETAKGTG